MSRNSYKYAPLPSVDPRPRAAATMSAAPPSSSSSPSSSPPQLSPPGSARDEIGPPPENTLWLGDRLSLVIGKADVTILDDKRDKSLTRSCCRVGSAISKSRTIPLYNVLWADVGDASITISFAQRASKASVKPASLTYPCERVARKAAEDWAALLLRRAYGESQLQTRFKVLVNPFGGQGSAATIWEKEARPILDAAHASLDVETTNYSGHAIEIAEALDIEVYDSLICCSGDGLPHEVFNGLGKRTDAVRALRKIAVCNVPGGSGNAMCWNLTGTGSASLAALAIIKSIRKPIDLASVTQGEHRFLSFLSQSFGMVAEVDLGTEDKRWMGGARFTIGFLQRVWGQTVYPCDLAVKVAIGDKDLIREHYRRAENAEGSAQLHEKGLPELTFGTINSPLPQDWELVHHPTMGNFYAGNMAWMSAGANFFPASLPNDGMFDLIAIDGTLGRMDAIKTLLAVESGSHFDMPHVEYRKVLGYRIVPHKREGVDEEYISIDGERIPFAPFQVEVHSGLGTVLAKGHTYQAPGV